MVLQLLCKSNIAIFSTILIYYLVCHDTSHNSSTQKQTYVLKRTGEWPQF